MAVYAAFKKLDILESTGMEEILAIVECNNCFVDGIQAISGCTLGNNALIYKDLGKTAVTFINRKANKAVRLFVKYSFENEKEDPEAEEARGLFERAIKRREKLLPEEMKRMKELWSKMSFAILSKSVEEIFDVKFVQPEDISYAPIYESVECSLCGENAMEMRIGFKEKNPICITCSGSDYWMIAGRGIHPVGKK